MKRTISLGTILLLVIIVLINSCSEKQVKIGLLMDDILLERWLKDKDLFIKRANEKEAQVLVEVANNDPVKQFDQAKKLLDEGIDILVIVPVDLNDAARIVQLAHQYKVRVLSYDRLVKNCNLDFYISFDNVEVGKIQAEYLAKLCPKGNFALIGGATTDNNSILLKIGQMNVLQPYVEKGDISIVYDQFVDKWHQDEGYNHMINCLKKSNNKIDAVIAANDALATGAAMALEENNMEGRVYLAGQDADLVACQRIVAGTQTITVYKPIEAIATKAADIAIAMAKKQDYENTQLTVNNGKKMVPALLLPPMLVNKETIKLTVVADGYLKENKIYQ
ncbi:MAG: substrate-binding domain-containing protein [Bacteroidales bacterium]|nr:MAG: substrate-binding domain-containing protein [Bacteroidales bacterium]